MANMQLTENIIQALKSYFKNTIELEQALTLLVKKDDYTLYAIQQANAQVHDENVRKNFKLQSIN